MMSGTKPATRSTIEQQAWAVAWLVWAHQPRHPKHAGILLENIWPLAARGRISVTRKHFMLLNVFLRDGSTAASSFPRTCRRACVRVCIFWRERGDEGFAGRASSVGSAGGRRVGAALIGCKGSAWRDRDRGQGPSTWPPHRQTPIKRSRQRSSPPACGSGTLVHGQPPE